jgi:glutaminyl-tRNA synthetase
VTFTNYEQSEQFTASSHPQRDDLGSRELPFDRQIYIDQSDFSEDTSLSRKKFKRLVLGEYVRLRGAYIIRADEVIRDTSGDIQEIKASVIENTVGADAPEGIRPRGVIHWVSALNSVDCTVNLYDRLFNQALPDSGEGNFTDHINPNSLKVLKGCKAELSLANIQPTERYQFEREGYFCRDSKTESLVFNRTIGLRDNWKA